MFFVVVFSLQHVYRYLCTHMYATLKPILQRSDLVWDLLFRFRFVPLWVKWRKITTITRFKVIRGHHFGYQSKARMWLPINEYSNTNFRTVSNISRSSQIFAFNTGVSLLNALVRGESHNIRTAISDLKNEWKCSDLKCIQKPGVGLV